MWQVHWYEMWSFTIVSISLPLLRCRTRTPMSCNGISHSHLHLLTLQTRSRKSSIQDHWLCLQWTGCLDCISGHHKWRLSSQSHRLCGHLECSLGIPNSNITATIILWHSVNRVHCHGKSWKIGIWYIMEMNQTKIFKRLTHLSHFKGFGSVR